MIIPKSINVLGETVTIKLTSSWEGHPNITGNEVGRFYPDTMTIYIDKRQPRKCMERFLLHEIGHVILFVNGLSQTLSLAVEESIVQSVASFFLNQGEVLFKRKGK